MWRKLQNILLSKYSNTLSDRELTRLNAIVAFVSFMLLFLIVLSPFIEYLVASEYVVFQKKMFLVYGATYILIFSLLFFGVRVKLISILFVSAIFFFIAANNVFMGGNLSLTFLWFFICILSALYLLGARIGLFFALLSILASILTSYLEDANMVDFLVQIDDEVMFRNKLVFSVTFLQLVVTVIIILYENVNQKNLELLRQKKLEVNRSKIRKEAIINGQEKERGRISKELHDGLAQMIVVVNMRMENVKDYVAEDKKEKFEDIQAYLLKILDETRLISQNLKPFILDDLGVTKSLENLIDNSFFKNNVACKYVIDDCVDNVGFYQGVAIFRIIQEAFNNILKHSQADLVNLEIRKVGSEIHILVEDNGVGVEQSVLASKIERGSSGIRNMEDRIKILEGNISFESDVKKGFRINIRIPYND